MGTSADLGAASNIDPYALIEALTGRRVERPSAGPSQSPSEPDYDDLSPEVTNVSERVPSPDSRPNNVRVGAINPYAICETLLGRKIDRCSINSARIISDVLQTDYDELFDLQFNSVLYAGLKLNEHERRAELLHEREIKIVDERDLSTPDLSQVQRLRDLERVGLKDLQDVRVKVARIQNGKIRLVLNSHDTLAGRTVSNRRVTHSLNEIATPFRQDKGRWTPPNSSWQDMYGVMLRNVARDMINDMRNFHIGLGPQNSRERRCDNNVQGQFDDPVQGAAGNSFFVAALFSVFWADPSVINRQTRANIMGVRDEKRRTLQVRFHDKGGHNNAHSATVDVNYEIPVNNSSNEPVYCRSSDGCEIWPSLYEKAFAKWITGTNNEHPDITQTHSGDPIKAMAQLNGREPHYYFTRRHAAHDLVGVVRACSVNNKTINPMAAFTHATGHCYRGANLVANHAYSVLGWTNMGEKQYIVLRNPWGVTEPCGLTAYPGLLDRVEPEFWRPAELLDQAGVLAIEAQAFKEYFSCIGVAK